MKPTEAIPGAPCWVELGTRDVPESGKFYSGLFGWSIETDPRTEAGGYTVASLDGAPVAAMSPLYTPGAPVAWSVSFAVLDADATAARAADRAGSVIMTPMEVFDIGRFAVLRDPTGTMFSIWQPRLFHGFGLWDEPGAACWVELATRDVPTANAFYQALFGWSISADSYPHLSIGDHHFGGVQDMNATGIPEEVPPHWLVYFKADDVAAKAQQAVDLGAQTQMGPLHLPGTGHFAVLRDPQGAVFALFQAEDEDAEAA
jgi:predicted enzyme related to lactoylglutathione lyase